MLLFVFVWHSVNVTLNMNMNMRAILHFWRACSLACSQRWSGLFLRKPASATEWKKILYIAHNCTLFAIIVTSSPNVTFFFIWPIVYFYTIHCDISKFWLSCNFVFFSFLPQFELFLIFRTLFLIILCCFFVVWYYDFIFAYVRLW